MIARCAGLDSDSDTNESEPKDNIHIPKVVPKVVVGIECLHHLNNANFGGLEELEDEFVTAIEMLTSVCGFFEIC